MRKAFFLTLLFALFVQLLATPLQTASASAPGQKPVVAIFPVNDNSSQKSGRMAAQLVDDKLLAKFGDGRYTVLYGQALYESLRREGIDDPRSADNGAVQAALRRMRVDYSIRPELLYVSLHQSMVLPTALLLMKVWTANVPLFVNVMDVNKGYAVYDSTIVETGRHEAVMGFANQATAVRNAVDKILDRLDREVALPE
ncbi:MAG: hypothetical protein P4N59_24475 [Negativicutes bacterium]|nr:hypothetical protein [Negativicutes bacterium]